MEPLSNVTVVLTRSEEQAEDNIRQLKDLGAEVVHFPTIKIVLSDSIAEFDEALKSLWKYDYLIFTSANAVSVFAERKKSLNITFSNEEIVTAAVGRKTAEQCAREGVKVGLIPEDYSAEGLLSMFTGRGIHNSRVLLPASAKARETLRIGLQNMGASVDYFPVYDAVHPPQDELAEPLRELRAKNPGVFIFTSPSTFNNFLSINNIVNPAAYFAHKVVCVIGPVTGWAVREAGLEPDVQPDEYTFEALLKELSDFIIANKIQKLGK